MKTIQLGALLGVVVKHGHMDRETENDLVNKKLFFSSGEMLLIDFLKLHEIGDQILK